MQTSQALNVDPQNKNLKLLCLSEIAVMNPSNVQPTTARGPLCARPVSVLLTPMKALDSKYADIPPSTVMAVFRNVASSKTSTVAR
jgi:hypothetical protein